MIVTTTDVIHKAVLRAYLAIVPDEVVSASHALCFFWLGMRILSADGMTVIFL